MKYYSTNKKAPIADLHKAVVKGLAEDRGLYMPEIIKKLPQDFFDNIEKLSFQEIAYKVADAFFGEDVDAESLKKIVYDTLAFDCPVVEVEPNIYSLELFHGPTLAFKDVGGVSKELGVDNSLSLKPIYDVMMDIGYITMSLGSVTITTKGLKEIQK